MTFNEYFTAVLGRGVDYDNVFGVQCFDLANDYAVKVLNCKPFIGLYAYEIYTNFTAQPSAARFTKITNTPDFVPKMGDIMVWAKSLNGTAGHVAICTGEGDTSYFYSYDQNWTGRNDPCTKIKHTYNHVLGVLRPKEQHLVTGEKPAKFNGIDISEHNGDVNLAKSEKDFVIIRSSYGNLTKYPSQIDKTFAKNVENAKKINMIWGVYHYSYATDTVTAKAEAEGFVKLLDTVKPIPYVVALDIEDKCQVGLSGEKLGQIVDTFADVVQGAGYFFVLYSYENFLAKIPLNVRKKYTIWCANTTAKPSVACDIHQHSFTGHVNGISGDVDLDKTDTDFAALIKERGLNGYAENVFDKSGWKKGDKTLGVFAVKQRLIALGYRLDDTNGFGAGTEKAVNSLLKKWGYSPNGVIGKNFIKKIMKN